MNYLFFYATKSPFSNFHPAKFSDEENIFFSSEQYMMYQKAIFFHDLDTAKVIMDQNHESLPQAFLTEKINAQSILNASYDQWNGLQVKVKSLGRKVKNYDEYAWNANRVRIVTKGVLAKFMQNEDLKQILIHTNDQILVEASATDKIWGIGLDEHKAKQIDPQQWPGQNLLGQVLMDVRSSLLFFKN